MEFTVRFTGKPCTWVGSFLDNRNDATLQTIKKLEICFQVKKKLPMNSTINLVEGLWLLVTFICHTWTMECTARTCPPSWWSYKLYDCYKDFLISWAFSSKVLLIMYLFRVVTKISSCRVFVVSSRGSRKQSVQFPWSYFFGTALKFRKRKKSLSSLVLPPP